MPKQKEIPGRRGKRKIKPLLNTLQAFEQLYFGSLSKWGAHRIYRNMKASEMRNIRRRFKLGTLSIEKMEWLLAQSGYKVIQEKLWR